MAKQFTVLIVNIIDAPKGIYTVRASFPWIDLSNVIPHLVLSLLAPLPGQTKPILADALRFVLSVRGQSIL